MSPRREAENPAAVLTAKLILSTIAAVIIYFIIDATSGWTSVGIGCLVSAILGLALVFGGEWLWGEIDNS
jgi:hypothetical protein